MEGMEATAPETTAPIDDVKAPTPLPPSGDDQEELPKAAEKKKYKVKIDGKEVEVDEDELVSGYQLRKASTKRFEEAANLVKKIQPFLSAKEKGDLNQLLADLPDDKKREWAENYLGEWLKLQEMDPKERENLEYKKKLEQYEKQEAERTKTEQQQRDQAMRNQLMAQASKEIDTEIATTVKELGVKPTPRLIARIAEEMLVSLQSKETKLPAKTAYQRAMKQLNEDVSNLFGEMEPEQLVQTLPKDVVKKILKYHTQKVAEQSPFGKPKATAGDVRQTGKTKRMPTDIYFDKLDKKYRSS